MVAAELARQEWADGYRRLESQRENRRRYRIMMAQVEVITGQLRRRVGSVFTVAELAAEYQGADAWVTEALAALPGELSYPAGVSLSTDAAFYLYVRGARDYVP